MKRTAALRIGGLLFVLGLIGGGAWFLWSSQTKTVENEKAFYISVIGPMSGADASKGQEMLMGVRLYLNKVNAQGGSNGIPIRTISIDDQNDPYIAQKRALELVEQHQVLLVLGHFSSETSIKCGGIYRAAEIPAISASATNEGVTEANDWYFRVIVDDFSQAVFLASYVKNILDYQTASLIYDRDNYGISLARTFESFFEKSGGAITYRWSFDSTTEKPDEEIGNLLTVISQTLQHSPEANPGIIVLAAQVNEAATIVTAMKRRGLDYPFVGGDSLGGEELLAKFSHLPEEQMTPGYFSNGIYALAPIIFDVAGEEAQEFKNAYFETYGLEPGWIAASYYDAAAVAVQAIQEAGITGDVEHLVEDRRKIRGALAEFDVSAKAIEGITGSIYFDAHGNTISSPTIGIFQHQQLVSALTQLHPVDNLNQLGDLDAQIAAGRILQAGENYFDRTNVVYIGVKFHEISDLDMQNLEGTLDFSLWFRYQGDFDAGEIEFLNAAEPVEMGPPVVETTQGHQIYRLYRIKGRFKADFRSGQRPLDQHDLGISFRHRHLSASSLMYVGDVIGMNLEGDEDFAEATRKTRVLNPSSGWGIRYVRVFQDISKKRSFGNPAYIGIKGGIPFSRFNLSIRIKRDRLTLRRILPPTISETLLVSTMFLLCLLFFFKKAPFLARIPGLIWIGKLLLTCLILLSAEVVILDWLLKNTSSRYTIERLLLGFDLGWWFVGAFFVNSGIERFFWIPLEQRTRQTVPNILRLFLAFIVYLLAFFGVVAFVFHQQLTGLLATSSVFAMIIGLALQINLSNIFSGIAINLEHPFRIGDWIGIGDHEGKVMDITWRTTRLETRYGNIISLPNSMASETQVHNYSYPDETYWEGFTIHVAPEHVPEQVEKILTHAVLSVKDVLEPWVLFAGISDWAADYWVYYHVKDYRKKNSYKNAVWKRVWTHLHNHGIGPVINPFVMQESKPLSRTAMTPLAFLQKSGLFWLFSEDAKRILSQRMRHHHVSPEEKIVQQGDSGDSLFIIVEGTVGVWVTLENGETIEVDRMGTGAFFGEMALLTGEPRTASILAKTETTLFEITKADIAPILEQYPETIRKISKELARRTLNREAAKSAHEVAKLDEQKLSNQFLEKISRFFGISSILQEES